MPASRGNSFPLIAKKLKEYFITYNSKFSHMIQKIVPCLNVDITVFSYVAQK